VLILGVHLLKKDLGVFSSFLGININVNIWWYFVEGVLRIEVIHGSWQ
jgi:hypothetical protein